MLTGWQTASEVQQVAEPGSIQRVDGGRARAHSVHRTPRPLDTRALEARQHRRLEQPLVRLRVLVLHALRVPRGSSGHAALLCKEARRDRTNP